MLSKYNINITTGGTTRSMLSSIWCVLKILELHTQHKSLRFEENEDWRMQRIQNQQKGSMTHLVDSDITILMPTNQPFLLRSIVNDTAHSGSFSNVLYGSYHHMKWLVYLTTQQQWNQWNVFHYQKMQGEWLNHLMLVATGSYHSNWLKCSLCFSLFSEVLSVEMMKRVFGANLLRTEMEIEYSPQGGSITDYTCNIYGTSVGVSVTRFFHQSYYWIDNWSLRAMKFDAEYSAEDAKLLLWKKLSGIVMSSQNGDLLKWSGVLMLLFSVVPDNGWTKQILHVFALNEDIADIIQNEFEEAPDQLKTNTILLVTICNNSDFIFTPQKQAFN